MSFTRSKKVIHEENKYLPPPGYYTPFENDNKGNPTGYNFNLGSRFSNKVDSYNPGPGSYFSNDKETIKRSTTF
jgi:hypothetical protein